MTLDPEMSSPREKVSDYFEGGNGDEEAFVRRVGEMVGAELQDDDRSQLIAIEPESLRLLILSTDRQVLDAFLDQFREPVPSDPEAKP